jgi:hypothetical protein
LEEEAVQVERVIMPVSLTSSQTCSSPTFTGASW